MSGLVMFGVLWFGAVWRGLVRFLSLSLFFSSLGDYLWKVGMGMCNRSVNCVEPDLEKRFYGLFSTQVQRERNYNRNRRKVRFWLAQGQATAAV